MNNKKSKLIIGLIVVFLIGGAAGFGISRAVLQNKTDTADSSGYVKVKSSDYKKMTALEKKYSKLEELQEAIDKNYYKDVNEKALMTGVYKGLFEGLNDPYSTYMTAKEYKDWMASTTGEFEGIGITFTQNDKEQSEIVSVIKDAPADKAGLKAGDIIMAVNGKTYDDMDSMGSAIRGKSGTSVKIKYYRSGKVATADIIRAKVVNESVSSKVLKGNIGYIAISAFEEKTGDDFVTELSALEKKDVKGVIIDLRNNGGGLVDSGIEVADQLLGEGAITYLKDKAGEKKYYNSDASKTDLPYVLLVNKGTASTSEIVSAAIKDYQKGKIVGTKTYGKGIVQSTSQLPDGDAIKMTIMQYFSPKGHTINKKGITPDYVVKLSEKSKKDLQLEKAIELLK